MGSLVGWAAAGAGFSGDSRGELSTPERWARAGEEENPPEGRWFDPRRPLQ